MEYYVHGIIGCQTIMGDEYCSTAEIDDPKDCRPDETNHAVFPTTASEGIIDPSCETMPVFAKFAELWSLCQVALVGYGVQNSTSYWIIKNSWSDAWGKCVCNRLYSI